MKSFTYVKDLNRSLIGLSPDIFYVMISGRDTEYSSRLSPSEAVEWIMRHGAVIASSNKDLVVLQVDVRQFKLSIWRNVPERVDLMGI